MFLSHTNFCFQKGICLNSLGTRPFGKFRVRHKICFCRMLIFNLSKSIIVINFIAGVCSESRPKNFIPDKTLLLVYLTLPSFKSYEDELQNCTYIDVLLF